MSSSPSELDVEARMRPGAFSKAGFLGPEERLQQVLLGDAKTLMELDITYEELASKLDGLITAAESASNHRARSGKIECQITVHPGFQICPWASDPHHFQCKAGAGVRHASVDWVIRSNLGGKEIRGPGLIVHLIRDHHFFEGLLSPHRVDPIDLARLLKPKSKM